jgi:hypothetical protein
MSLEMEARTEAFSYRQEEIIMRQKRWVQHGILGSLVLGGLVACAMIASPPQNLIAKNDHAALAIWYEKEAAHLRQHAKEMRLMEEQYKKNPGPDTRGVESPKLDFVPYAVEVAELYEKAAEKAEALAQAHRSQVK